MSLFYKTDNCYFIYYMFKNCDELPESLTEFDNLYVDDAAFLGLMYSYNGFYEFKLIT